MPHPATVARTAGKVVAWFIVVVLVLAAVLAVFVATFDWNRARPWVDDKVSQAIGRPFAINGDLRVGWEHPAGEHGWRAWVPWPRFSAYDVTIGNPPWAASMTFAKLDEIGFDVEVLPLLAHVISIPSIDLVNPSIDLERLKDGRANWVFKLPKSNGPSRWTLRLNDLGFKKAHIDASDELKQVDLHVDVDTLGKPLPIGDVMKQQETAARGAAAHVVGERGARQLAAQTQTASGPQEASSQIAASSPSFCFVCFVCFVGHRGVSSAGAFGGVGCRIGVIRLRGIHPKPHCQRGSRAGLLARLASKRPLSQDGHIRHRQAR